MFMNSEEYAKKSSATHNSAGITFAQQGRIAEAIAEFRQAASSKPDFAEPWFNLGIALTSRGQVEEAAASYRAALALQPDYVQAHNNLGLLCLQLGKTADAITCFTTALNLNPDYGSGHNNLGNALREQGKLDDAVASYRRALEQLPHSAEVHLNLGIALAGLSQAAEAAVQYRQALSLRPDYAEAHNSLGNALKEQGEPEQAVAHYRQALALRPNYAEAHNNLGLVLAAQGKLAEAVHSYQEALDLRPNYVEAYTNMGNARAAQGRTDEAVACYREALRLEPDRAEAHNNLGVALRAQWKLDEAAASYLEALRLKPDYAGAHNNLGIVRAAQGRVEEAVACYREAVRLDPSYVAAHTNLVLTLYFCPDQSMAAIAAECRRWNDRHAEPLRRFILPNHNDRSPGRRLRVGYVSPDLRWHPVGRFLLPLLEAHNHEDFEIYCYAASAERDWVTEACAAHADVWRPVFALTDEEFAQLIRRDEIDILVDLAMHTVNNRLLTFARKPAPVQATYLAYVGTTGLTTMDYRLSDPYLDPPGGPDEALYSEKTVRLPDTFWCFRPDPQMGPVTQLPASTAGHVTFGCLNSFWKVSPAALTAWARLLEGLPGSRLLLHAFAGSHRERVLNIFAKYHVARERIVFIDPLPAADYFRMYQEMDIALDPFPYGGGTTSFDALWMGVPVVTLAGDKGVGRGGLSILANLELTELVAGTIDDYLQIATKLALDLARLSQLRGSLRERMLNSPLMDAARLARHVETAYRAMWRSWCSSP